MDGTIDAGFAIDGTSFSSTQSVRDNPAPFIINYSYVKTVYVDALGDIYAGGAFWKYKSVIANNIVKIKHNGAIASITEFNSGNGFQTFNSSYPLGRNAGWYRPVQETVNTTTYGFPTQYGICVEKIIPHINGILVTGNFAHYDSNEDNNWQQANALVKINTNGTMDLSFNVDTAFAITTTNTDLTIARCGYDIKALNDGTILFGGYLVNYLDAPSGTKAYYVLNSDGSVNSTTSLSTTEQWFWVKTIASYFL